MEKTYKITAKTNDYIAKRSALFNGKREVDMFVGLTLKQAQDQLLFMFNCTYEDMVGYCENWGMAVIRTKNLVEGATPTFNDGTRWFSYDSRLFSIVAE